MTTREQRLRGRIDQITDDRDRYRDELLVTAGDLKSVVERDDFSGRLVLTLRARLREVQRERDEALAALWAERDMSTRNTTAVRGSVLGESAADGRGGQL